MFPWALNSIVERAILTVEAQGVAVDTLGFANGHRYGGSRTFHRRGSHRTSTLPLDLAADPRQSS
jgi:hypothetical protein